MNELVILAIGATSAGIAALGFDVLFNSTTGFIPLVPGVAACTAMMELARHNMDSGLQSSVTAASLTLAIGAGLGVVDALMKAKWR